MRAFIVLCLIAFAAADRLGYDYQPGSDSSHGFESIAPGNAGSGFVDDALSAPLDSGSSGLGGDYDSSASSNGPADYAPQAEYEKEFYTFTANENEFDDPSASEKVAASLRRGLRVVFIKGPENRGLEDAALALAKQAAEQRTAIYVLNKQTDIGDLANKLNALRNDKNNRPDVHFVKYRTPEDAANAQRAIQSSYDNDLPGASNNVNGGVAPVLNFASNAPARPAQAARQPDNSYLPSSIFRRRF